MNPLSPVERFIAIALCEILKRTPGPKPPILDALMPLRESRPEMEHAELRRACGAARELGLYGGLYVPRVNRWRVAALDESLLDFVARGEALDTRALTAWLARRSPTFEIPPSDPPREVGHCTRGVLSKRPAAMSFIRELRSRSRALAERGLGEIRLGRDDGKSGACVFIEEDAEGREDFVTVGYRRFEVRTPYRVTVARPMLLPTIVQAVRTLCPAIKLPPLFPPVLFTATPEGRRGNSASGVLTDR